LAAFSADSLPTVLRLSEGSIHQESALVAAVRCNQRKRNPDALVCE
jgi:hypothetical protein